MFLEDFNLLGKIYEKFKKEFEKWSEEISKNPNSNEILNEFKYVDMRQEITKEKLENIYCNLRVETDDGEIEVWSNGFEEILKKIKNSILNSDYFSLYNDN